MDANPNARIEGFKQLGVLAASDDPRQLENLDRCRGDSLPVIGEDGDMRGRWNQIGQQPVTLFDDVVVVRYVAGPGVSQRRAVAVAPLVNQAGSKLSSKRLPLRVSFLM
jgi:hypothetical protein